MLEPLFVKEADNDENIEEDEIAQNLSNSIIS